MACFSLGWVRKATSDGSTIRYEARSSALRSCMSAVISSREHVTLIMRQAINMREDGRGVPCGYERHRGPRETRLTKRVCRKLVLVCVIYRKLCATSENK